MRRKMNFCVLALACISLLSFGSVARAVDGDKSARSLEAAYIPQDAVAVLVAHPADILESERLAGLPLDEPFADFKRGTGLDAKDIEQVVIPLYANKDGEPAVVIRTKKPFDKEKVGGEEFSKKNRKEAEHEGKKYFQGMREQFYWEREEGDTEEREGKMVLSGKGLYFVDDTTLIVGAEKALKKMITAEKADSKLIKKLKATEPHDFVLLVDLVETRGDLDEIQNRKGDGSQEDKMIKWAAKNIETVSFWADASPKVEFQLTVSSGDASGGGILKKYIDEKITQAEGAVKFAGPELLKGRRSPIKDNPDLADKILKFASDAIAAIKTKDDGKAFVMTFTEPEGARAVLEKLIPALEKIKREQEKRALERVHEKARFDEEQ